ncbi:thiamine phosphate synthase [Maricurvus nonylphenolicus]|uniref:thiamine phosphate synthase n=1 Tax=Maricurvus nonylphenolicus TaxID=1008307 RepID=UPI0036F410DF
MTKQASSRPIVWAIAASDSGGCAGIQADLRTLNDLGTHGCSVITALTAQNTQGIQHIQPTSADNLSAQLKALSADLPPKAIKLSVIPNTEALSIIKDQLAWQNSFCVYDPVISSTSGNALVNAEVIDQLPQLYPYIDLLTPNLDEASRLSGVNIKHADDVKHAAEKLLAQGVKAVLIKGGHSDDEICQDFFSYSSSGTDGQHSFWLTNHKQANPNSRATGCTLSSAIAAFIAQGKPLQDALVLANAYVQQGLRLALSLGDDNKVGTLANAGTPETFADFPQISDTAEAVNLPAFPRCDSLNLGLYPVVDSIEWLEKLLPLGVKTIQLRVKNKTDAELDELVKRASELGHQHNARMFINDHWQLAIKHKAYGVHLGQEDLDSADLAAIREAGVHLGLSTHSEYEWARAATFKPSYLAIGAIFPTDTKEVIIVGTENLHQWVKVLSKGFPLTAIGGIKSHNLDQILSSGVGSVAVVTAITAAEDYVKATEELMARIEG